APISEFLLRQSRHPPKCTLCPYTTLFRSSRTAPAISTTAVYAPSTPIPTHGSSTSGTCAPLGVIAEPATLGRNLFTVSTQSRLRSEEHTSELQSRENLVCRLLLEKKKNKR